jgi:hypothetical protein
MLNFSTEVRTAIWRARFSFGTLAGNPACCGRAGLFAVSKFGLLLPGSLANRVRFTMRWPFAICLVFKNEL